MRGRACPDGKKIVHRAEHPTTPEQNAGYKTLYAQGLIRPGNLEIWVMDAGRQPQHQVTHNGAAIFAPFYHPDGKRLVWASNRKGKEPHETNVFIADCVK
jgi:TolB protein